MKNENILTLRLTGRKAVFILTVLFLAWHPGFLGSEILTMTTYYPAPYGGYASLLTTGQTLLARDGGAVGIGTSAPDQKLTVAGNASLMGQVISNGIGNNYFAGSVGIGTSAPAAKLDVNGQIRMHGGSPGAGKVLMSDASGLASWQAPASGECISVVTICQNRTSMCYSHPPSPCTPPDGACPAAYTIKHTSTDRTRIEDCGCGETDCLWLGVKSTTCCK